MTKLQVYIILFVVMEPTLNAFCQKAEIIKLDDLKINSVSIRKDSVDKFLNEFGVENLKFKEYPLASGDKLNFYFNKNLKFIVVFFGDQNIYKTLLYSLVHIH
jgi:hypothetical protein